jgi:flagellar hook-length control protein FliK
MNAMPTNLNPVNAIQPAASAKQQDAASPDTPFSQVLSSEMAQSRGNREAREGNDAKAATEAATETAAKPGAATKADAAAKAKAGDADEAAGERPDPLQADSATALPDVLALATQPDLKPVAAGTDGVATEQPPAVATDTPVAVGADTLLATMATPASTAIETPASAAATEPGKGRAPLLPQVAQAAGKATDAQKTDSELPKADFQAAAGTANSTANSSAKANPGADAGAMATAFSEKLAAARQSDSAMSAERVSDLMSNPAVRPAPHAALGVQDLPPGIDPLTANKLTPSVGTTAWGQALGEKVVWMAAGAQQTASLTLNPPNLGPLQIVLHVSNDQATASFFSAQPEVRQALESAFPRLREMMNDAGIQLGEATVSADTPRQNDTPERQAQRVVPPFIGADDSVSTGLHPVHEPVRQSGRGLIDTFA